MTELTTILCVAFGVALSELVLMGMIVVFWSVKDRWDAHQWRKQNPSPRLADIKLSGVPLWATARNAPTNNIIWRASPIVCGSGIEMRD